MAVRLIHFSYRTALLYWFTRQTLYWFSSQVYYHIAMPLFRLATTPAERRSVMAFVIKWVIVVQRAVPRRFVRGLTGDTTISVGGLTYVVDLESGEALTLREIYEARVYDRLDDFIPTVGWTVFDVGANVGMFSLLQAQRGAHVVAFEPNPDCFARCQKAISLNKLEERIDVYNKAVGAQEGVGALTVPYGLTPSGAITPSRAGTTPSGSGVDITTLSTMCSEQGMNHIDLLKIDVEGAEVAVLEGATEILHCVERVLLEYHSPQLLRESKDILEQHGLHAVLEIPGTFGPDAGILYACRG